MSGEIHCPLCMAVEITAYFSDSDRSYLCCSTCGLVFVPPDEYVSRCAEKAEYELHHNDIDDLGYRKFLSRLMSPLVERLSPAPMAWISVAAGDRHWPICCGTLDLRCLFTTVSSSPTKVC